MLKTIAANPAMLKVKPASLAFLNGYMHKFRIRQVGTYRILHSHLPPLNSAAYSRFIKEQLLGKPAGPSHAQIGITNACPQRCEYCYNRTRQGQPLDKQTIIKTARQLRAMGMVWLGLTGGEPLLNKDITEIVESVSADCAVKLFTTGCTLTPEKARSLKAAGLFSVSVSLDHWQAERHDRGRGYPGAFSQALKAIEIFKNVGGMQVGVSAVLSREMIRTSQVDEFLNFLSGLGIHEAWLSEVKPSLGAFQDEKMVISEEERLNLFALQDRYNAGGRMTVNYLGHFEGKECFGCNAGNKMVYVDAFGEVSPCVFTPVTFGNVKKADIASIFSEMKACFPTEDGCFINKNYRLLRRYSCGRRTLNKTETLEMLKEVRFGDLSHFNKLHYKTDTRQEKAINKTLCSRAGETA
jgi:MoaA/NifB/PqqE/SkfB family radical SAM enzyme